MCDDRPTLRRTVTGLLTRCGFGLAGEAASFADLHRLVLESTPTVAIITLPVPGMNGLSAVTTLRAAAPHTEIVLLSAFGGLDLAARQAGALALVAEDDPQALRAVLLALSRRRYQPEGVLVSARYGEALRDSAVPSVSV